MNKGEKLFAQKKAKENYYVHCNINRPAGHKRTFLRSYQKEVNKMEESLITYGCYHLQLICGNGYNDSCSVNSLQHDFRVLSGLLKYARNNNVYIFTKKEDIHTYKKPYDSTVKYINADLYFFLDKEKYLKMKYKGIKVYDC